MSLGRVSESITIRDATDDDALDLIALVAICWSQYAGCVLDVHGEEPQLLRPASYYAEHGGRCWVAVDTNTQRVVGTVAYKPSTVGDHAIELKQLYVDPRAREHGLGGRLTALVEGEAQARGCTEIDLWSDTRFETAHGFYERRGYLRGETRALHDLSQTIEYSFRKLL